jgi:A/G-specific adenine glycosylase
MIVEKFESKVPRDRESLQLLPGIGPYCSASIMAFAFDLPAPVVDTNVRSVLISEL